MSIPETIKNIFSKEKKEEKRLLTLDEIEKKLEKVEKELNSNPKKSRKLELENKKSLLETEERNAREREREIQTNYNNFSQKNSIISENKSEEQKTEIIPKEETIIPKEIYNPPVKPIEQKITLKMIQDAERKQQQEIDGLKKHVEFYLKNKETKTSKQEEVFKPEIENEKNVETVPEEMITKEETKINTEGENILEEENISNLEPTIKEPQEKEEIKPINNLDFIQNLDAIDFNLKNSENIEKEIPNSEDIKNINKENSEDGETNKIISDVFEEEFGQKEVEDLEGNIKYYKDGKLYLKEHKDGKLEWFNEKGDNIRTIIPDKKSDNKISKEQEIKEKLWDKKTAEKIKFEESPKEDIEKESFLSDQGEGIPDVKESKEFFEKLPEESKEKIKFGLNTVGFLVEQKKNNFYAKTFGYLSEKSAAKSKTVSNFLKNLGKGFEKDSKKAFNTAEKITNKEEKHKRENATLLFGNILRHGRMITDLSGFSFASPLRYVMMAGMALSRGSKAALETRLENEKVIEKTRIQDIEEAEKEAWKIYNKAKDENNGEVPSTEKLKDYYLKELPNDIQKRLENPSATNNIIQNIIKSQMEASMNIITYRIDSIKDEPELSNSEKEQKINNIFKKYEEKLLDYDKIISQYGTVDVLSVAGRYAQTLGKGVVAVATIETLYLSAEKTIENISKILSSNETYTPETGATQPITKIDSSNVKISADTLKLRTPTTVLEQQDSLKGNSAAKNLEKVLEDSTKTEKPTITDQEKIQIEKNKILKHFIHKGEGVEHSFIRQIEGNKELAEKLKPESNFKGDLNDPKVLHSFAQNQAHVIATNEGYVNDSGQEVRITEADKVSYEIKTGANGEITVEEKGINGEDPNKYEKIYEKQNVTHEDKNTFHNTYTEEKPYDEQEELMKNMDSSNYEDTINHTGTTSGHKVIEYDDTPKNNTETNIDEANITKNIFGKEYTALTWAKAPENIYHISLDQFREMNELNTKNIDFIINNSPSNDIEKTELISILKEDKAGAMIGMKDEDIDTPYRSLGAYINKLHEITKLKPKSGTIITPAETNENYIYRALMKAAELKKLGELKLSK